MADLTAAGAAHRLRLAGGVGREVVVVQVGLLGGRVEVVELLGIARRAEGGAGEHLGEAPLEQARAMHPLGQHANGRLDWTNLIEAAAIDALALLEDLLAHQFLGEALEAVAQHLAVAAHHQLDGVVVFESGDLLAHGGLDGIELAIALGLGLAELLEHLTDRFGAFLLQEGGQGWIFHLGFGNHLLDTQIAQQLELGLDQFAHGFVAEVDRLDHVLLGQLVGACLHHHHTGGRAGHHQVKIAALNLPVAGVEHEVVAQQGHPHRRHRAGEGDLGQEGGDRGPRHGEHVGWNALIERQHGGNHLDVIPQPGWEKGPQGAIDQPRGEDGALRGARFAAEEAAGNPSGGIQPLFVVAGEGEEIDAFAAAGAGGGHENRGIAAFNQHRTPGLGGETTGGQSDLPTIEGDRLRLSLHWALCPFVVHLILASSLHSELSTHPTAGSWAATGPGAAAPCRPDHRSHGSRSAPGAGCSAAHQRG